jgi:hypothetical protein
MKKQLLFIALFVISFINGQSIEFTSAELSTAEVGSTVTVSYKYTSTVSVNIYCAINKYDAATWNATIVDGLLSPAVLGTEVVGSFDLVIPSSTELSEDLIDGLNYKLVIEMTREADGVFSAGDYPATEINIVAEGTLSINNIDNKLKQISLYPNPTNNTIRLTNFSYLNNTSIKVFNLIGKEVLSIPNSLEIINVSSLEKGIYILNIKSENATKNIKFIKN